ncbi:MAG: class I SAM-dependent methyltransferase, partial [Rhizobium sp.]|nr:class I SAM-dependent methyltransferase [Rhizobium sp.]
SEGERAAWQALFVRHLGRGEGRRAVDLACGTAVISHLLDDIGFRVTGIDWAEPMLERARRKAAARKRPIEFLLGDAEVTMEPDNSADVVTNRHLVWTLVDPAAAFREWHRILKPGGKLLLIDGDFVNPGPLSRLFSGLSGLAQKLGLMAPDKRHGPGALGDTHRSILSRVYFSSGARADEVVRLLTEAGFADIRVDFDLKAIHRQQRRNFSLLKGLERATQHRYAISAVKTG